MGVQLFSARMRLANSNPSILGIITSRITTSKSQSRTICNPSLPSAAHATVCPSSVRPFRSNSNIRRSSSTTSSFIERACPVPIGREI